MKTPKNFSKRRLIENEQLIQQSNEAAKKAIERYFALEEESRNQPIAFYCECSDETCHVQISLSIADYERTHKRKDHFTIAIGHESTEVEKIVETNDKYAIVEKYDVPAAR